MSVLRIHGDPSSDFLTIEVLRRKFPQGGSTHWDENLLETPVEVHIGGFEAHVIAEIRTDELRNFRDELALLYENLEGDARLYVLQNWVDLTFHGDGLGHIHMRGTITDNPGIGNVLKFELRIDQTFLPEIILQLDNMNAEFPVLDKPEN